MPIRLLLVEDDDAIARGLCYALEQEGYLRAEAGRGVFASSGADRADGRREALLKQLDEAVTELLFLGMTPKELAQRVSEAGTKGESAI